MQKTKPLEGGTRRNSSSVTTPVEKTHAFTSYISECKGRWCIEEEVRQDSDEKREDIMSVIPGEEDGEEVLRRNIVKQRIQYFNHQVQRQKSFEKKNYLRVNSHGERVYKRQMVVQSATNSAFSPRQSTGSEDEDEKQSERKAANIAKEIMESEKAYVDKLRLLNEDFRSSISSSKDAVIPPGELNAILSYLPELQLLNGDLLSDFSHRMKSWDSDPRIADIMVNKGKFLLIYGSYIKEFPKNSKLYGEALKKYPKFKEAVLAFQARKECKNLKIEHLMLEPIQRLPRYKLLFERYFKNISKDCKDYEPSLRAIDIIKDIAEQANKDLKENDAFKKMLNLQSRANEFDLIEPDRELLKEGELLKISRSSVDPRYIVLLSDILLYTTSSSILSGDPFNTSLRIHYRIPLLKLRVDDIREETYAEDTDFQIVSSVRSCILRAGSLEEKQEWMAAIHGAVETLRNKRSTFDLEKNQESGSKNVVILGEIAPVWIPDRKVSMCQACTVEFSVLIRRHHCRGCGIVTCSYCSDNRAPLKYLNYKSDRVCDSCYDSIKLEYYFQDAKENGEYLHLFRKREEPKVPVQRIVPTRLKMKASTEGALASGYLRKRIVKSGKWKKLWFVLKDSVLYEYKASSDSVASDTFPVLGLQVETISERIEDLNIDPKEGAIVFQLLHAGLQKYSLCFKTDNEEQLNKWVKALKEASTL